MNLVNPPVSRPLEQITYNLSLRFFPLLPPPLLLKALSQRQLLCWVEFQTATRLGITRNGSHMSQEAAFETNVGHWPWATHVVL